MKKLSSALLAASILAFAHNLHAQGTLTNGLVCYYTFNGSTADQSGNGNNPTAVVATPALDRFGNPTNALAFNGVNSVIYKSGFFANRTFFPNGVPEPVTESIWFCPSNTLVATNFYFLMLDGNPIGAQYGSAIYGGGSGLQAYYYTYNVGGFSALAPETTFPSNAWYHVVGVMTTTNIEIFINGLLQASVSFSPQFPELYGDLDIGAQVWNSGSSYRLGFVGRLDDVRIYNRALSAAEVAELYALESPPILLNLAPAFVPEFTNLQVGVSYQLQVSTNLTNYSNYGQPFVATSASMYYSSYFLATNTSLYFRLQGP